MKLRISGNSIRLRLSISEVQKLVLNGTVHDSCQIGRSTLTYQISQNIYVNNITVSYLKNIIDVKIPKKWLENWDIDDRVGFEGHDASGLYILIEKDFQCMKPRLREDESDLYINPNINDISHG